ncbi:MAG: response regulator transcription factor [Crocinitomicaceae bacterium]|nr:response regulator transcription factor [Crocinitomicaceae bacterium]
MKALKILIADDHMIVRNGLKALLKDQFNFCPTILEATNGAQVVSLVAKNKFDLVILDATMPKVDGFGALELIQKNGKVIPTITLIDTYDYFLVKKILGTKSLGILSKNVEADELMMAIRNVLDNKKFYCNEVSQLLINESQRKSQNFELFESLTKREKEILEMVAKEYTNDEIGSRLSISKRTVEGHRKNLKSKLRVKSTIGLFKIAFECGQFGRMPIN